MRAWPGVGALAATLFAAGPASAQGAAGGRNGPPAAAPSDEGKVRAEALLRELSDPDPERRAAAAAELLRLAEDKAVPEAARERALAGMRAALGGAEDAPVLALLRALQARPGAGRRLRADLLKLALEEGRKADLAREAARAAGGLGDPSVLGELAARALDASAPVPTRARAVRALEGLDAWGAIEPLTRLLEDPSGDLRAAALAALRAVSAQDLPADPAVWRDWWSRNRSRPPEEVLRERLRAVEEERRRERAALAAEMQKLLDPASVPANQRALSSPLWEVRRLAALNLGKLRDPASRAPLVAALDAEGVPEAREAVAEALGDSGIRDDPEAVAALARRSAPPGEPEPRVRAAAVDALGRSGAEAAAPPLLAALSGDPDP
ncbi:MAG: HEAT repeat domain-containing protein, partial [Planctomycetales bacterium]|nr:HEAT repeat domain-containing protein [Planctomycetales bacterium]